MKMRVQTAEQRRFTKAQATSEGNAKTPRIAVFRSNRHMYAQAIDDAAGRTLASSSTHEKEKQLDPKMKKADQATAIGETLGARLQQLKISRAVFDRRAYRYHGRVKAVAEGVRKSGVQI